MTIARALIADDEPALRERLRALLASTWPDLDIVEASDGLEAMRLLGTESPRIAFLDIRMPGMTGLEIAAVHSARTHIVFVTAHDEYAIAAFETGALDYVVKPVEAPRLAKVVERLKARMGEPPADLTAFLRHMSEAKPTERLQWIQASVGNQVRFVHLEEILYLQSDTKYTRVVTREGEAFIRTPVKGLASRLDPETFWQIHRGTIVNTQHLLGVKRMR